jgi:hypothetical protein
MNVEAQFVSYHDFGEVGAPLAGTLPTHQVEATTGLFPTASGLVELVRFPDGAGSGINVTIAGTIMTDLRGGGRFAAPAGGTPADALFNRVGLGLTNGSSRTGVAGSA